MRGRKEIERDFETSKKELNENGNGDKMAELLCEIMLDIRDLLRMQQGLF